MSDASILVEPLFHMDVFVLAAAAASLCLLAIWAGLSRRHWFLRAAAVAAVIVALTRVHAYQPALLFAGVLPLTAATAALLRRRINPGVDRGTARATGNGMRFGLRDLLLAVLLVCLVLPSLWSIVEKRKDLDLKDTAVAGAAVLIASSLATVWFLARANRMRIGLGVILGVGSVGALTVWLSKTWTDLKQLLELQDVDLPEDAWISAALVLLPLAEFTLLVVVWLQLARLTGSASGRPRVKMLARAALAVGMLATAALLGPIYWHMLRGPSSHLESLPGGHVYQHIASVAERAKAINPTELPLDELRDQSAQRGNQLEALYGELLSKLDQTGSVPLDMRAARYDYTAHELPNVQLVRSLVRAMDNQARQLASVGRFDEASQYALASVQVASTFSRGGLFFHTVFGNGIEGIGVRGINDVRQQVSIPVARALLSTLKGTDAAREPIAVALARNRAWDYEVFGWRIRLAYALSVVTGCEFISPDRIDGRLRSNIDRRDAALRLLIADLAIRLFEFDRGRLPHDQNKLVPEYLSAPPLDPFSGRALIYRRDEGGYQLYSVGPDGRDDEGHFGRWSQTLSKEGWDLSLDGMNQ